MNLGQFIRSKRKELGMTVEELADKINSNKAFVSRIENNKIKSLKNDMILPLADALQINPMQLFNGYNEEGFIKAQVRKDVYDDLVKMVEKNKKLSDKNKEFIIKELEVIKGDSYASIQNKKKN